MSNLSKFRLISKFVNYCRNFSHSQIGREPLDTHRRLDTLLRRFNHNQHHIHTLRSAAPQVFDPRLHVHDHHFVILGQGMADKLSNQDILRAGATAASLGDMSHNQQANLPQPHTIFLGNIVHLWIHGEV